MFQEEGNMSRVWEFWPPRGLAGTTVLGRGLDGEPGRQGDPGWRRCSSCQATVCRSPGEGVGDAFGPRAGNSPEDRFIKHRIGPEGSDLGKDVLGSPSFFCFD